MFFKHLLGEGDVLLLGLVLGHPFLRVPGVPFGLALRIQLPVRYRSMEGNILDIHVITPIKGAAFRGLSVQCRISSMHNL